MAIELPYYPLSNVGVNDSTKINADLAALAAGAGTIDGTGTANYLPKWSDADTLTNSVLYESGGKIALGHTSIEYAEFDILGENAIQYFRVSGLAHGMTDICPTNVAGEVLLGGTGSGGNAGGIALIGLATGQTPLTLLGISGDAATGYNSAVSIGCGKKSGTFYNDIGATEIAFSVKQNYSGTELLKILGNGNIIHSGNIYTVALTDYSGTSTIQQFSAYNTKILNYEKKGDIVCVEYSINGTSNGTGFSFTLPYASTYGVRSLVQSAMDNGSPTNEAYVEIAGGASLATVYNGWSGRWTGSGQKYAKGYFSYRTAS